MAINFFINSCQYSDSRGAGINKDIVRCQPSTPSEWIDIILKEVCWWGNLTIIPQIYEILP